MIERDDRWTPPDGLGYSSLRPVRLTRGGKAMVAVTVALAIGGVVLGAVLQSTWRRQAEEQRLLHTEGLAAEATVTRAWIDGSKERQPWIAYRFQYAGRIYSHRIQTPRKMWQGFTEGATVPVRFVPSKPSISHPTAWDTEEHPWWLAFLIGCSVALPSMLQLIPIRRQARLLAEGRPAPGRVTGFRKTDKAIVVKYQFRLLSGATANGKSSASKPPVQGSSVCVLYDPENPRRNALYPLSLVRLDRA